jgi:predicted transcriptional regulator
MRMQDLLVTTGLTKLQAQAYLYLLKNGATFPGQLTTTLRTTRTNTYKVLESLEKLGLVSKGEQNKKVVYTAEDPVALTSLVAEKRNNIIALEKNVNEVMQQLRKAYVQSSGTTKVRTSIGKEAIVREYQQQAELGHPLYFVKARSDIPFLGFETIHAVRVRQGQLSPARYGITTDTPEAPKDSAIDRHTKLTRTWIDEKDYTAPVEWSMGGDTLLIQVLDGDGRTITIQDELVAESFKQLWQLMDRSIRNTDGYQSLPVKAKRMI